LYLDEEMLGKLENERVDLPPKTRNASLTASSSTTGSIEIPAEIALRHMCRMVLSQLDQIP